MWPDITHRYRRHFELASSFNVRRTMLNRRSCTYTSTQPFVLTDRHYLDNRSAIAILPKAPEEEDEERASKGGPRVRKGQGKAEKS